MVIITPALTGVTKNAETFGGVITIRCGGKPSRRVMFKEELPGTEYDKPIKYKVWNGSLLCSHGKVLLVKKPFKNLNSMVETLSSAIGMQPTPTCVFNVHQKKITNLSKYVTVNTTFNIIVYPRGVRPKGRELPLLLTKSLEQFTDSSLPQTQQSFFIKSKPPPSPTSPKEFDSAKIIPLSGTPLVGNRLKRNRRTDVAADETRLAPLKNAPQQSPAGERIVWKRGVTPAVRLRSVQPPRIPHVECKYNESGDIDQLASQAVPKITLPSKVKKEKDQKLKHFLQGTVDFPIALISSKVNETPIRIDGGGVIPGSLASTHSGDLYKVEWVCSSLIHARRVLRYSDIHPRMSGLATSMRIPPHICFLIDSCCSFPQGSLLPTSGISYLFWADLEKIKIEPCGLHESRSSCPSCNQLRPHTRRHADVELDTTSDSDITLPCMPAREVLVF